jgi:hypothetical protein
MHRAEIDRGNRETEREQRRAEGRRDNSTRLE